MAVDRFTLSPIRRGTVLFRNRIPAYSFSIHTSASASINLSFDGIRIGARASAILPKIVVNPVIVTTNVTANASIGLSVGSVRFGSKASANLILSSSAIVSKQKIVTASAILPPLLIKQRILVSAILPLINASAIVSVTNTITSVGWISNLTLEETTKFTNFNFINIIRLGNNIYGVKSDGLYLLGASTDNGTNISSHITTHPQNYKQHLYKRIPYLYTQTPYPISVTSYVDSTTLGSFTTSHGKQKIVLSKGAKGYYWSFKIANVGSNPFKLDGIEPFIDFLKRRA